METYRDLGKPRTVLEVSTRPLSKFGGTAEALDQARQRPGRPDRRGVLEVRTLIKPVTNEPLRVRKLVRVLAAQSAAAQTIPESFAPGALTLTRHGHRILR